MKATMVISSKLVQVFFIRDSCFASFLHFIFHLHSDIHTIANMAKNSASLQGPFSSLQIH